MTATSKSDEAIGRVLERGRYRLEACIGCGGMGSVYRATDTRLGVERAIKLIHVGPIDPQLDSRAAGARVDELHGRLITEALAAQRLGALTRHVVRVFDVGRDEGDEPFLVMELLDGETLETRLDYGGPLAVGEALSHARVLAETVGLAHQNDILHRDIKPSNLMFVRRGAVDDFPVVLDFGLAHLEWDGRPRTRSGDVLGTVPYMAPELLLGQTASPQSDVFAIGAVLYEMLAGVRAVPGGNDSAVFRTLLETGVRPLAEVVSGMPEPVCAVVDRCVRKRPHQRPATAMALASALDGLIRRLGEDEARFIAPIPDIHADEAPAPNPATVNQRPIAVDSLVDPLASLSPVAGLAVDEPEMPEPPTPAAASDVVAIEAEPEPLRLPVESVPGPIVISPPSGEVMRDPLISAPRPALASRLEPPAWQPPAVPERRPQVVVGAAVIVAGLAVALGYFALGDTHEATAAPHATERARFPLDGIGKPHEETVTEAEVAQVLRKPAPPADLALPAAAETPTAPPAAATPKPATRQAPAAKRPRSTKRRGGVIAHYAATRDGATGEAEPAPSGGRRFFAPGGTLALPEAQAAGASALPAGTQVEAELTVGISSARHVPIVARITAPVIVAGQTIAPAGALLEGRSTDDGQRIYLDFTRLGDHRVRAHAVSGGRPGLTARKRGAPADERGGKALARGALDTAGVVAAGLGAGVAGDLARNMGREAVSEARHETRADAGVVLEVAAGARFTVVVTGGQR